MVDVILDPFFKKKFQKIKSNAIKERVIKQLSKIKENPEMGKPMRFVRKGTRELYIPPFRLSYRVDGNVIYILDLYHKDEQ